MNKKMKSSILNCHNVVSCRSHTFSSRTGCYTIIIIQFKKENGMEWREEIRTTIIYLNIIILHKIYYLHGKYQYLNRVLII
jgi:hypothetical protein